MGKKVARKDGKKTVSEEKREENELVGVKRECYTRTSGRRTL